MGAPNVSRSNQLFAADSRSPNSVSKPSSRVLNSLCRFAINEETGFTKEPSFDRHVADRLPLRRPDLLLDARNPRRRALPPQG
ncbi:unnamed protein product [Ixodes pacificus]